MEIRFKEDFSMFSKEAKDTLHKHVKDYALSLKDESERVAASRYDPDGEVQVTKGIVENIIGVHGHHVVRKPHLFYTYILPVLEAIAGGVFCAVAFKSSRTTLEEILMVVAVVGIVISIFMRHNHDTKK